jgi:WD40 repeat protein
MEALTALGASALATCSEDSSVRVWGCNPESLGELNEVMSFPDVRNDLRELCFSFDLKYLGCICNTKMYVFDLMANKIAWELDTGSRINGGISFSKIDYRFLNSRPHDLLIWDGENGKMLKRIMQSNVVTAHFTSDDDSKLACLIGKNLVVKDLQADNKDVMTVEAHNEDIDKFAFNSKGSVVITGSKREPLKMWNIATGETLKVIEIEARLCTGLSLNSDASRFACYSTNGANGVVKVWDTVGNAQLAEVNVPRVPNQVTISPTGNVTVSCNDGYVVCIDGAGNIVGNWKCHKSKCTYVCHAEPVAILM